MAVLALTECLSYIPRLPQSLRFTSFPLKSHTKHFCVAQRQKLRPELREGRTSSLSPRCLSLPGEAYRQGPGTRIPPPLEHFRGSSQPFWEPRIYREVGAFSATSATASPGRENRIWAHLCTPKTKTTTSMEGGWLFPLEARLL